MSSVPLFLSLRGCALRSGLSPARCSGARLLRGFSPLLGGLGAGAAAALGDPRLGPPYGAL